MYDKKLYILRKYILKYYITFFKIYFFKINKRLIENFIIRKYNREILKIT